MKTIPALLLLAAVSAGAQNDPAVVGAQARRGAQDASARARVLDVTLAAMNDGVTAGGRVIAYLNEKGVAVSVAEQAEAVKTTTADGRTSIVLSASLPAHPRAYGPLIAQEAAKMVYADMPPCGERAYMVMATAARVFQELGGEFKALPVVDGDAVPAVKDAVAAWTGSVEATVDALAARDKAGTIPDLLRSARDQWEADEIYKADRRFTAFLLDEKDVRAALKR